ncbi:MAG: serine/threonine protein kinase, partial [Ktedonobacteraceae bacterium]|nr:serine/threonine protein kinase [Ktedonobacteraceae bacterium]
MSGTVDQLIGTTVRNYHITRLLGQGNLSVVYLAEQQTQRLPVMLTFFRISPEYSDNARDYFFARFSQVAGGLIHLNHPAILPTLNFGEYFSSPFLVTPYVEETSLTSVLRQQRRCTPEQTLNLLRQVASGLDHAHEQGVIHGTLRSANILLSNEQIVHMTGFGLAQMLAMRGISSANRPEAHLLNINGSFLYSPEHIAPEIVRGAPPSAQADVYALGILAFELLTGQLPFTGSDPFVIASQHLTWRVPSLLSLSSDVPAGLDLVIQKALERDP